MSALIDNKFGRYTREVMREFYMQDYKTHSLYLTLDEFVQELVEPAFDYYCELTKFGSDMSMRQKATAEAAATELAFNEIRVQLHAALGK